MDTTALPGPSQPGPTPPPDQRPLRTGAPDGWNPTSRPYAPPAATPGAPPEPDAYSGILDDVHRIWSNALDEPVPQQQPDQPSTTPFHDAWQTSTQMEPWKPVAEQISKAADVPPDVTLALIHTTSGGDPTAKVAGGQAVGLAAVPVHQFAPGQNPTDPATNLGVALGRLKQAYQQTGDWTKAALAVTGFGDQEGEPRVLGRNADGFEWRDRFEQARRQYQSGGA